MCKILIIQPPDSFRKYCDDRGASLVKVNSLTKSRLLMDKAKDSKKHIWTGLRYYQIGVVCIQELPFTI